MRNFSSSGFFAAASCRPIPCLRDYLDLSKHYLLTFEKVRPSLPPPVRNLSPNSVVISIPILWKED